MSKALIILTLLLSLSAFAENHMLFMGGGAEPVNSETTIFDDEVKNVGSFLNQYKKNWKASVTFNGGHAKTEQILNDGVVKVAGPNKPFIEKNFQEMVEEYEKKIDNGDIKPGDQLLVYITTHGAQKTEKSGKSHEISLSGKEATNLNNLDGADLVSMDKLQGLIDKAAAKGVKLGIMDFSCHSGASINLKNPNTCIITASGPNHFGYSSWGERFARNMSKGKNLEDIYLETFVDRYESAFPMISTNSGVAIQDQLYDLLTPYLHYWKPNANHEKLSDFLNAQVEQNKCEEADLKFEQLTKLTTDLEVVFKKNKDELRDLKKALTEYHEFQKKMKEDLKKFNIQELKEKKENICVEYAESDDDIVQKSCTEYTYEKLFNLDVEWMKKYYSDKAAAKPSEAKWSAASIQKMEKAEQRRKEILEANPKYQQFFNYYKSFPELEKKTWDMAIKVSSEIQKVYPLMYKENAKTDKEPNPCKSFVL